MLFECRKQSKLLILCSTLLLIAFNFDTCNALECYGCQTNAETLSKDCLLIPKNSTKVTCDASVEQCYSKVFGNNLARGCATALVNLGNALMCNTTLCNSSPFIGCLVCDSRKDSDCLGSSNITAKYAQLCAAGVNACSVAITADGATVRGCANATTLASCANATCTTCNSTLCNTGIFPAQRLECHQCQGPACNDSAKYPAKPCLQYNATAACYTYGLNATAMERGCSSDAQSPCPNATSSKLCALCNSSNGCNAKPFEYVPTLECVQGVNVSAAALANATKPCATKLKYYEQESCYAEQLLNGSIARGCASQRTAQLGACPGNNCTLCANANGCNNMTVKPELSCIQCASNKNKDCAKNPQNLHGVNCQRESIFSTVPYGCYSGKWAGVVRRGCLSNLNVSCTAKENCTNCTLSNCNTIAINGAATLRMSFGILLCAALMIILRL